MHRIEAGKKEFDGARPHKDPHNRLDQASWQGEGAKGEQRGVFGGSRVWGGGMGGGQGLEAGGSNYCTDVMGMSAGVAPEVQVSHGSGACLTLASMNHDLSPLLDAPCKLLPFGLHPFLRQVIPRCESATKQSKC